MTRMKHEKVGKASLYLDIIRVCVRESIVLVNFEGVIKTLHELPLEQGYSLESEVQIQRLRCVIDGDEILSQNPKITLVQRWQVPAGAVKPECPGDLGGSVLWNKRRAVDHQREGDIRVPERDHLV